MEDPCYSPTRPRVVTVCNNKLSYFCTKLRFNVFTDIEWYLDTRKHKTLNEVKEHTYQTIGLKIPKLSIIPFQGMSNYLKVPSSLLLRFDKAFSTADVVLSKYSFRKIFNLSLFIVSSFGMQSTLLST